MMQDFSQVEAKKGLGGGSRESVWWVEQEKDQGEMRTLVWEVNGKEEDRDQGLWPWSCDRARWYKRKSTPQKGIMGAFDSSLDTVLPLGQNAHKPMCLLHNQSLSPPDPCHNILLEAFQHGHIYLGSLGPTTIESQCLVWMGPEESHQQPTSRTEPSVSLHYWVGG